MTEGTAMAPWNGPNNHQWYWYKHAHDVTGRAIITDDEAQTVGLTV